MKSEQEALRNQIRHRMAEKDTEELESIWVTNNQLVWTPLALEMVKEILLERTGRIPKQNQPILTEQEDEEDIVDILEPWEQKLIDAEDQPAFYDTFEVISICSLINKLAKASIVLYFLMLVTSPSFLKFFLNLPRVDNMVITELFISFISALLNIAITYIPLRALSQILRILIEMEFNSRKTTSRNLA